MSKVTIYDIIGEIVILKEQFSNEVLSFNVLIEERKGLFTVATVVKDSKERTLNDIDYTVTDSRETAQNHADIILNAIIRSDNGIKVNPTEWTKIEEVE